MVKNKKAQAAMEFLMTYGWAIIAVLVSVAALAYFGVLSPALFVPESCTLFSGLGCSDISVTNSVASMIIINSLGQPLNPFTVYVDKCGKTIASGGLLDGEKKIIEVRCNDITATKSRFSRNINITYSQGPLTHTRQGKVIASVSNNYIHNPGFEYDESGLDSSVIDNWFCGAILGFDSTTFTRSNLEAYSGSYSLMHDPPSGFAGQACTTNYINLITRYYIPIDRSKNYEFCLYHKAPIQPVDATYMYIDQYECGSNPCSNSLVAAQITTIPSQVATTSWTKLCGTILNSQSTDTNKFTDFATHIRPRFVPNNNAAAGLDNPVYIDDISFREA